MWTRKLKPNLQARCPDCDRLGLGHAPGCPRRREQAKEEEEYTCWRCGKPIERGRYCYWCGRKKGIW